MLRRMSIRGSTPQRMRLANVLRTARQEANLRQVDIAERLGVPQSYVSKYESGDRSLTLFELEALARVLGLPLIEIVRRFEEKPH